MMKKFLSFIAIAAVAAVAFISCEEKPEVPADIALKGITVSPATYSLAVGETKALTVAYDPEDATIKPEVEWTSFKPEVATVDGRGTVTGVAAGTADIVAKAGEFTAKCVVTVVGEPGPEDKWDYTPCADYSAASNLWKPVFDADGENYFYYFCNGADWNGTDTETTEVPFLEKKTSTYKITIENGTSSAWQNQIFIMPNTGHEIALDATKQYRIQVTFGATEATRGFIKAVTYGETGPKHEGALIHEVGDFQMSPDAPTIIDFPAIYGISCSNINFVMDFGGAPAGTVIYIKDIIVAEDGDAPAVGPEDNWDYTPSEAYKAAANNLWKPIFDGNFDYIYGQITDYGIVDITNYDAVYKNESTYRLTFAGATSGEWGNCNFLCPQADHKVALKAGTKYNLSVTLGATAAIQKVIFSLHADDPTKDTHEGAWLIDLWGELPADTPTTFTAEYTPEADIENISWTIIPQFGTPAGMMFYIKDIIIEEVVNNNVVPEVFAGTYKVSKIMVLGAVGSKGFVDAKEKSWMWNSSVNKEYDNLLVLSSTDNTADYQAGADGAYWDYILVADKNKLGTGDMDLSHNFGQLPHGVVPCNINTENGLVTLNNSITAQGLTAGTYPFAVDWASAAASVTVPEGCIALAFQCKVMPDGDYTWDDSWANTDFDRFAIHPFYCVMIFAKQ